MIEKEMEKVEAQLSGEKKKEGAAGAAVSSLKKKKAKADKGKGKAFFAEVANAEELKKCRRRIARFSLTKAADRIGKEQAARAGRDQFIANDGSNKRGDNNNNKDSNDNNKSTGNDTDDGNSSTKMDTTDIGEGGARKDTAKHQHDRHSSIDIAEYRQHKQLLTSLKTYQNYSSEIGDLRPVSSVKFSPDSRYLVSSSWSGDSKLWSIPDGQHLATLKGHTERVTDIQWHPRAGLSQVYCTHF